MWEQLKRIIKPNGAIVLFWSEPFSSALRMSNIKQYKYDWIWNKKLAWNWILAKIQPLKIHELVHIFSDWKVKYNPQMTKWKLRSKMWVKTSEINSWEWFAKETYNDDYYPISIQEFSLASLRRDRLHPTQKPVALLEYLIKTYTNEWETVLDFTAWSFTTAVACENTNRKWICIEMDKNYFDIATKRICQ